MNRRDFYRYGSILLGNAMALGLAVPGVAYLLDPLRKSARAAGPGDFRAITRLGQLPVGVPRSFAVIADRTDAWVAYPAEPIGSVWLVRQPDGAPQKVVAFTSECPHLGCAVSLGREGQGFYCPCHTSSFNLQGQPINEVPPRGMDTLEVKVTEGDDPEVLVKFARFRTMSKEKIPLG